MAALELEPKRSTAGRITSVTVDNLPNAIVSLLFSFLTLTEYVDLTLTSRRYHRIGLLPSSSPQLLVVDAEMAKKLRDAANEDVNNKLPASFLRLRPKACQLEISSKHDEIISTVVGHMPLSSLRFDCGMYAVDCLNHLSPSSMVNLEFRYACDESYFHQTLKLTNLTTLNIGLVYVTQFCALTTYCTALTSLKMDLRVEAPKDRVKKEDTEQYKILSALCSLPLQRLSITSKMGKLCIDMVNVLATKLKALTHLSLSSCCFMQSKYETFPALVSLEISGKLSASDVTTFLRENGASLINISFEVNSCDGDYGHKSIVEALTWCPQLTKIRVVGKSGGKVFPALTNLKRQGSLESLREIDSYIDDEIIDEINVSDLAHFFELTLLKVQQLPPGLLPSVLSLPKLRFLGFVVKGKMDASVLASFPSLVHVQLMGQQDGKHNSFSWENHENNTCVLTTITFDACRWVSGHEAGGHTFHGCSRSFTPGTMLVRSYSMAPRHRTGEVSDF